jgi:transposase
LDRFLLSDAQFEKIAPILPGKNSDPGRTAANNRLFVEAVLWIVRTGAPWRDLPVCFGCWNSAFRRFRRWSRKGVFEKIFNVLPEDPDFEYAIVDGTIVRVHQHGAGAKGGLKIRLSAARGEA